MAMKFELSPEQRMIRDVMRDFALTELEPIAEEIDKVSRYPEESVKKMAKAGIMGISVPMEYGGAGADSIGYVITIEEISKRKLAWQTEKKERAGETNNNGLNSLYIMNKLSEILPKNAIISLDVRNNTYSFGRYFECKKHRVILSGYLGSIGFSFPAAMGAYYAEPDTPIVSISGDGGFGQYMTEFNTAVLNKMKITHILINNNELGKISKEQRDVKMPEWQTKLNNPNFAEYANNCGGFGIRVTKNEELEEAVKVALNYNGPSIVEIIADPLLT